MSSPSNPEPTLSTRIGGNALARPLGLLAFLVLAIPYALSLARSTSPFDRNGDLLGYDFFAFYFAGTMVNAERADALYDWTAQRNLQRALVHEWDPAIQTYVCPYLNPPHYAWLMSWFTPLDYAAALALWWTLGLAAFLCTLAIWRRWLPADIWPSAAVLAIGLPAWFQTFAGGQNTFFTVLILSAACHLLLRRRNLLAGVALSLLAYKFQLLAVPALFLAYMKCWRALAGLALGLLTTVGFTLAYFGPEVLVAYFRFASELPGLMQTSGFYAAKQHSWYGFVEQLSDRAWPATSIRLLAALLSILSVAAMLVYVRRSGQAMTAADPGARCALARALSVMLVATVLASPHLFQYDLLLLAPAAVLWRSADSQGSVGKPSCGTDRLRWHFAATIAAVMLWSSFASRGIECTGVQLTPLLLAAWLVAVLRADHSPKAGSARHGR